MNSDHPDKIFISELGRDDMLGRNERTIRTWVRDARKMFDAVGSVPDGYLPVELWPSNEDGGRRRIYWLHEQLDGLRAFAEEKDRRKGWQGATVPTP